MSFKAPAETNFLRLLRHERKQDGMVRGFYCMRQIPGCGVFIRFLETAYDMQHSLTYRAAGQTLDFAPSPKTAVTPTRELKIGIVRFRRATETAELMFLRRTRRSTGGGFFSIQLGRSRPLHGKTSFGLGGYRNVTENRVGPGHGGNRCLRPMRAHSTICISAGAHRFVSLLRRESVCVCLCLAAVNSEVLGPVD